MTRPMSDPSTGSDVANLGYRVRQLERRGGPAMYEIKVFGDTQTLTTGDGAFIFAIPLELEGSELFSAEAFVTTDSSSGAPEVQIRNVTEAVDMLLVAITIDANTSSSYQATTRSQVDTTNNGVSTGDLISIDVDGAGTGAMGLGVILRFGV
jgi:hypothetical protein